MILKSKKAKVVSKSNKEVNLPWNGAIYLFFEFDSTMMIVGITNKLAVLSEEETKNKFNV